MSCMRIAAPVLLAMAFAFAAGPAPAQRAVSPPDRLDSPAPLQPGDAFGEEVTLPERTIVYLKGHSKWDAAFDTLVDAFKSLNEYLDKQSIKPAGPVMTIYTETDDAGFSFNAAVPIAAAPANPPKGDIAVGPAPTGKALKFVHRGSYDAMDSTYEAITNYLDDKHLEARDLFIEEYVTDPVKTNAENLVVNVFVPLK
jgi:effector-binding domain-containing protein